MDDATQKLDPYPWVHRHDGCIFDGRRRDSNMKVDEFRPREKYEQDRAKYGQEE